ncbi:MAG: helix-turn-helix domain-containing protein [Candidatus Omnitrophica bacterium]|nr:helix-turn-helix domain-containing protein [Candidatus Omnitrophota bacterium]
MIKKTFLTIEQVAERFGINSTTVYRLAQRGLLPGFKVGSQWRFSEEMLESWIAAQVNGKYPRPKDSNGK